MPINPDYPNYPNVEVVSAPNSSLFTNYVFKAIPLAFDDSMSYYETLCGLLDYLKNTIIPTVNNNADAVSELQQLYDQLHDYVKNYFDNVNVQAEINNKLDAMVLDGTLENLIGAYIQPRINQQNITIQTAISQQNQTIADAVNDQNLLLSSMQTQINALENVGPLVAASTAEMTDTTKIYVNTTDGHWYWYNGSAWTSGGSFQQSGISDGQISFLMFSDEIKSNFNYSLSENITPTTVNSILYTPRHGRIDEDPVPNLGYSSYTLDLEVGKTYMISGVNRWTGQAFLIANSDGDILYNSTTENTSGFVGVSKLFNVQESGLVLYVNRVNYTDATYPYHYYMIQVCTVNNIYNNFKINNSISPLYDISDYYPQGRNNVGVLCHFSGPASPTASCSSYIYPLCKGLSYTITSQNLYEISGVLITDLSYYITYKSWTEYTESPVPVSYTFTAEEDGYAILCDYSGIHSTSHSISINYPIDLPFSNISGKTVLWAGDSIANGEGNNNVSYANMISNQYSMPYTKYTAGGRCITKENGQTSVLDVLPSMSSNADFVIFEGGWNDMYRVPLGVLSSGFNASLNEYTWIGALESLVKQALAKWPSAHIGFVLAHGATLSAEQITMQNTFWDAAISVFNKWHLPYIDLRHNGLCAYNNTLLDTYFMISQSTGHGDGTHPNDLGYQMFYNNQIASWMNTL